MLPLWIQIWKFVPKYFFGNILRTQSRNSRCQKNFKLAHFKKRETLSKLFWEKFLFLQTLFLLFSNLPKIFPQNLSTSCKLWEKSRMKSLFLECFWGCFSYLMNAERKRQNLLFEMSFPKDERNKDILKELLILDNSVPASFFIFSNLWFNDSIISRNQRPTDCF